MAESLFTPRFPLEHNKLVEKIGKKRVQAIAALGFAAAAYLGISGKPNSGVGIGVESFDWDTGATQVAVGVALSSTEDVYAMGFPKALADRMDYKDFKVFQVSIGGVKLAVWQASLEEGGGKTILGIYPGFETTLGQKKVQTEETSKHTPKKEERIL